MNTPVNSHPLDTQRNLSYNQSDVERIVSDAVGQAIAKYAAQRTHLENCTDDAHDTPKEDNTMAYTRQRVIVGYNDKKPVYRQISGTTQDERDIEVVRAFIESGRIIDFLPRDYIEQYQQKQEQKEKHNFFKYIWDWYCIYKEPNISTKYKETLIGRINRICQHFGSSYVEDVKAQDVQSFLSSLSNLTTATIGSYRNVLSQVFDSALEDEIIFKNPAKSKRLKISGTDSPGNQALSLYECDRLISILPTLEDRREAFAIALMLFAGLRREEMLGLKWSDIDFDKRILHVSRAVVITASGSAEVKTTKTKSSKRPVPMPDTLIDLLKPHRQRSGFIVTNDSGGLFTDYQYKLFWDKTKQDVGLPDLNAPILRHTYATMNAAAGVDIKTVGACMGHSKIATTADVYTQVEQVHAMNVRNNMSDYIRSNVKNVCQNVQ